MIQVLVEKASLIPAINAAWLMCGALTALILVTLLFVKRAPYP